MSRSGLRKGQLRRHGACGCAADVASSLAAPAASRIEEVLNSLTALAASELGPGSVEKTFEAPRIGRGGGSVAVACSLCVCSADSLLIRTEQNVGPCRMVYRLLMPLVVWAMLCAAITVGATLFNESAPITIRAPSTEGTSINIPAKAVAQLAAQLQGPILIHKVPQMIKRSSSCTSCQGVVGPGEAGSRERNRV